MADANISIPASIAQLRGDRAALKAMPLTGSLDLHDASAVQLLGAFGRTDVTGGTLGGKVTLAGTVGKPTAQVHLSRPVSPRSRASPANRRRCSSSSRSTENGTVNTRP